MQFATSNSKHYIALTTEELVAFSAVLDRAARSFGFMVTIEENTGFDSNQASSLSAKILTLIQNIGEVTHPTR